MFFFSSALVVLWGLMYDLTEVAHDTSVALVFSQGFMYPRLSLNLLCSPE